MHIDAYMHQRISEALAGYISELNHVWWTTDGGIADTIATRLDDMEKLAEEWDALAMEAGREVNG